jgi:hypothetical protein
MDKMDTNRDLNGRPFKIGLEEDKGWKQEDTPHVHILFVWT